MSMPLIYIGVLLVVCNLNIIPAWILSLSPLDIRCGIMNWPWFLMLQTYTYLVLIENPFLLRIVRSNIVLRSLAMVISIQGIMVCRTTLYGTSCIVLYWKETGMVPHFKSVQALYHPYQGVPTHIGAYRFVSRCVPICMEAYQLELRCTKIQIEKNVLKAIST